MISRCLQVGLDNFPPYNSFIRHDNERILSLPVPVDHHETINIPHSDLHFFISTSADGQLLGHQTGAWCIWKNPITTTKQGTPSADRSSSRPVEDNSIIDHLQNGEYLLLAGIKSQTLLLRLAMYSPQHLITRLCFISLTIPVLCSIPVPAETRSKKEGQQWPQVGC